MISSTSGSGRLGVAVLVVVVEAGAGLLAAAAQLAEHDRGPATSRRAALRPSRCRGRRGRSSRTAPSGSRSRTARGRRPAASRLPGQLLGLAAALGEHAVADEAVADADQHRRSCRSACRAPSRWRSRRLDGCVAAHDLEQPHDVGRAEEVQADHRSGRLVAEAISSMSRSRCWWRGSRRACTIASSLAKISFLTSMCSNTASITRSASAIASTVERAGDQAHALLDVARR